jgi:hypothetical protein
MNLLANVKVWSGNTSSPRTKKFRSVPSAGKVMLMVFWDFNGPILQNYQDYGQMVSNAQYCTMLEEELKHAISKKMQRNTGKCSSFAS